MQLDQVLEARAGAQLPRATMRRLARPRVLAGVLAAMSLAACGGDADAGDGAAGGGIEFTSAPALGPAPTPLPQVAGKNVCEGYRFGGRELENLEVPDGAACVLESGVRVDGNVELGTGSELYAQGVFIGGNVQGQGAAVVLLEGSRVGGSVQLEAGGAVTLSRNEVTGSIQLKQNASELHVLDNVVNADVQLFDNLGGVEVSRNAVDGNLQCKENAPAPTGGGNTVQGNKEDQCAGL